MDWNRRQLKVYVTRYTTTEVDNYTLIIDAYGGYGGRVCEWAVWTLDNDFVGSGVCYGVKEAKTQAEQAARDYDAKERVK